MSSSYDKIIKNFVQTIRESDKRGTSPYDTTAEVLRVDGDTAWVHIAGGVDETPVRKTIDCKAGDVVQLRVGGGRAWITGNATAPPTDDTKANKANENALSANKRAITAYKTAEAEARDRKLIIREVAAGIEVGFENSGYKALINGEGSFDVVDASDNVIASFGTEVAMKSAREQHIDEMGNGYYSQNFMNIKSGEIQLKRIIDGSAGIYDGTYISGLTAEGIKPSGTNSFILHDGVYAEEETNLWYTTDNVGADGLVGECFVAGWVTGSSQEVMFTIPLTAPIANNYDVEAVELTITVRQNNKYLVGSGSEGKDVVGASDTEDLEVFQCPSGINVHYYRTSAFSGAVNNDVCGIKVEYAFNVTKNQ